MEVHFCLENSAKLSKHWNLNFLTLRKYRFLGFVSTAINFQQITYCRFKEPV